LVNELNELQTYKLINPHLTLIVYAILMEGFELKYWTSHDPDLNRFETDSPSNYTLFFFVTTCIIYGVGIIQYAASYILVGTFPQRYTEFVDLCSITNMSVLMFDESFHGYYIHGRSPFGQAEIS
jgi:meckelin